MSCKVGFIVEGHCEYDSLLSFISKIIGSVYFPISNAKGIGNIIRNTSDELLKLIKLYKPEKVIIVLDYREALREGIVENCIELKDLVMQNCNQFLLDQANGSLTLPEEIIVIIADKTYETWLCADFEGLKENELIDETKITEEFSNVDLDIENPGKWLNSKLREQVDLKSKANRKLISKTLRPEVAKDNSRSFRKFYSEIIRINTPS